MGTRHLIRVKVNGKLKVSHYGQWDGYPSGQGVHVVDFIQGLDSSRETQFRENVQAVRSIPTRRIDELLRDNVRTKHLADKVLITHEESKLFRECFPQFHRDTGADILDLLLQGDAAELYYAPASKDNWLEYIYTLDLDKRTLTIKNIYLKKSKRFSFNELNEYTMRALESAWSNEEES